VGLLKENRHKLSYKPLVIFPKFSATRITPKRYSSHLCNFINSRSSGENSFVKDIFGKE
jgi:hypothetical protein